MHISIFWNKIGCAWTISKLEGHVDTSLFLFCNYIYNNHYIYRTLGAILDNYHLKPKNRQNKKADTHLLSEKSS